jgi:4-hydroxy-2-oxoheptanedioate aldolase
MNGTDLKGLWKTGRPSFGGWISLTDPAVAAIMANAGFDWVYIDGEHNPFNPETLRNILLILRDRGTVGIVRVREVDEAIVKQVLDWGAEGILFPMIRTASDARRAVAACRYPPVGVRGFNPREASNFFKNLDSYLATANDRILAILQVELAEAVANLDEILRVPGVDGIMIGPMDLSYSLGVPRQLNHPLMQAAINTTIQKTRAAGLPVGMTWKDSDAGYFDYLARGLVFISPYADADFLRAAADDWLRRMQAAPPLTGGGQ